MKEGTLRSRGAKGTLSYVLSAVETAFMTGLLPNKIIMKERKRAGYLENTLDNEL